QRAHLQIGSSQAPIRHRDRPFTRPDAVNHREAECRAGVAVTQLSAACPLWKTPPALVPKAAADPGLKSCILVRNAAETPDARARDGGAAVRECLRAGAPSEQSL